MESNNEEQMNKILDELCSPPSLKYGEILSHPPSGEEIVVTGIAGSYPEASNVLEFQEKLFNKEDMVNDDPRRWRAPSDETPQRIGKLVNIDQWDAGFFGQHFHQAFCLNPMTRIFFEKTFEALLDAGMNPAELSKTRTGIFMGTCLCELEKQYLFNSSIRNGFALSESPRHMMGSKCAYVFGLSTQNKIDCDTACSSSCYAIDLAYKEIREGKCDTAIVAGSNLCMDWMLSRQFAWLGVLCKDGKCKVFDDKADGYARSESIVVAILQKAKDARRMYCRIVHSKTNQDGFKDEGITYPSGLLQQTLFGQCYREAKLDPLLLSYIEAHGTGTSVGDPEEANAICDYFCKNRKSALSIGSVKSSIGHSEPTSGLNSLTKVIISMETGYIPPNIYFDTPNSKVEGFKNNKMKVVTETEPLLEGMVGINSFGFGGGNAHLLLEWNKKQKKILPQDPNELPRIVALSGRTKEALKYLFKDITSRPLDKEYIRLFHAIHSFGIPGHNYRGYALLSEDHKETHFSYYTGQEKELVAVFSGLEKGWAHIGKILLKFPLFTKFLEDPSKILKVHSFDLVKMFESGSEKSDLHSIVASVVVQMGIVNLFQVLNVKLDRFAGISYGEIVAAFADGIISAEEATLIALKFGEISQGINKRDSLYLGSDINALQNQIYSGEIKKIWEYKENYLILSDKTKNHLNNLLIKNGFHLIDDHLSLWTRQKELNFFDLSRKNKSLLFKKTLNCSSSWLRWQSQGEITLNEYLILSITNFPKLNHILSHLNERSCLIELSPTELFKKFTNNINIFNFGTKNNKSEDFLTLLGKLFEVGAQPKLDLLYPKIEFPVSRGTPMISPLIKWDYKNTFVIRYYFIDPPEEMLIYIHLYMNEDKFYEGHMIDGRNLFPATGYLYIVWTAFMLKFSETYFPIIFEDVRFVRAISIPKKGSVALVISYDDKTGLFEIYENSNLVSSGKVKIMKKEIFAEIPEKSIEDDDIVIEKDDIYKELRLRGYQYNGLFRGLRKIYPEKGRGFVEWRENWVAFMDNLLQPLIFSEKGRGLFVPTTLERVIIDPKRHEEILKECEIIEENEMKFTSVPVKLCENLNIIQAGGVEIRGFNFSGIQRRKATALPVLEKYLFIPFEMNIPMHEWKICLRIILHLILENLNGYKIKILEFARECESEKKEDDKQMPSILSDELMNIFGDLPLYHAKMLVLGVNDPEAQAEKLKNKITLESRQNIPQENDFNFIICNNLLENNEEMIKTSEHIDKDGMLVLREKANVSLENVEKMFKIITQIVLKDEMVLILKKNVEKIGYEVINFKSDSFEWIPEAKKSIENCAKENQNIIFVSENEKFSGILGFFNCITKEHISVPMQCFLINDPKAPEFNVDLPFYKDQITKNIRINILNNGVWGSYRHLCLEEVEMIKAPSAYVDNIVKGDLSSLKWIQTNLDPEKWTPKSPKEQFIQVHYSSLNFRDIMYASGKLAMPFIKKASRSISEQGFEFSGKTLDGRRVFGIIKRNALATYIKSDLLALMDVPDEWTLEEAATIPVIYTTCIFSFYKKANITAGETILIHSATGGIGQAAINLALHKGCRVLATCAPHKKKNLLEIFPNLDPKDIGNSRDCSFYDMVMSRTDGRGVDVVLNSLAEEKQRASLQCLVPGGQFLELGKYDFSLNNPFYLESLNKGISFHSIMLDQFLDYNKYDELANILLENLKSKAIKPIDRTIFELEEQEAAFRYMTTGKHLGKVLIKIRPDDAPIEPKLVSCVPKFIGKEEKSYIIIGGLGGIGLELANWLIIRGVYKIILNSRSGVTTGYQTSKIELWRKEFDVTVVISQDDITDPKGVEALLKKANELGPIGGIFNLAVNLKDNLFENQTEESFKEATAPKALATQLLDIASRELCPLLEYFVVFSSVSCGRGNISQTNYGLANSVMERVIEKRKSEGFPALAIQWGAVGDVGLVAKMQGSQIQNFSIGGTLLQGIESCLATLDIFLNQTSPIVSSMVVAEKKTYDTSNPVTFVANILSIKDLKSVSHHVTLAELGMDSMTGVEIIQGLEREFQIVLTPKELRSMTFAKLHEYTLQKENKKEKGKENAILDVDNEHLVNILHSLDDALIMKPIISLSTLETTGNPIFFIPGFESTPSLYTQLAKRLKAPVYFLYPLYFPFESFSTITQNLIPLVLDKVKLLNLNEIFFIAYSLGSAIAFDLIKELEMLGHKCRLVLIDGSPEFVFNLSHSLKTSLTQASKLEDISVVIESYLLMRMVQVLSSEPLDLESLFFKLVTFPSWDERLQFLHNNVNQNKVENPMEHTDHILQITKLYLISLNEKVTLPEDNELLSSLVYLIRPEKFMLNNLEEDYGLRKYFKNQVKVIFFPGDHRSILNSEEVADFINEYFECNPSQ